MSGDVDVAVVGAGAAGIAAARRLVALGRSVLVLEALPRLGGRADTVDLAGLPFDLGCGWLHSAERNPLAALADAQGRPLDRSEGAWRRQLHDIDFPKRDQSAAWAAYERLGERLRHAPPPSDRAGDAVAPDDPWRPFLDGLSGFLNGVELDQLSIRDFLAYDDAASEANWRLPTGYGAFLADLGAALPVALDARVTSLIEGDGVTVETDRGTVHANAAIVSVSSNILARGDIRFAPALDDHLQAAARLPLGLDNKVFLALSEPDAVPPESHLLGQLDRAGTGSYYLRPFGRPVIEAFLGGRLARDLEAAGEAATYDFVRQELRELLGARFAGALTPLRVTRWGAEPTILGSYSHAEPGHADARAALATPPSARLCFAGEACSAHDYSTAHGAWQSGIAAADWIAANLPRAAP
ncbi:MAG: FAD-dependent oxidoreductase [Alphaproteobacteria bacterium]|nr:FAD-dependent oxidoreductase [Alphaproteobacteria bacterium]MBU1514798.1 FAD-dependent oxidoreductase [Alphaproteobacteria bacterium]MBU2093929.1 FAD-dependent oxidoreductase [Alphaproteobacteria bacterium]MBU2153356.1 FAD-dependent oxidoreductase [Alphaproteobacteria bacterium]MBU2309784.1 FAD-dependent oxidoreductase [Alphaproteobacteria bacterium]